MSRDPLRRLLANLHATRRVYADLLRAAQRKQNHILASDIRELRRDLEAEERLAGEGARLNAEREQLHRLCCRSLGLGQEVRTLEGLCRFLPQQWRERFQAQRRDLLDIQRRLQDVNRMNVALVNNCLELMEGLLAALFDVEPVSAYGPRGVRRKAELPARSLDTRA